MGMKKLLEVFPSLMQWEWKDVYGHVCMCHLHPVTRDLWHGEGEGRQAVPCLLGGSFHVTPCSLSFPFQGRFSHECLHAWASELKMSVSASMCRMDLGGGRKQETEERGISQSTVCVCVPVLLVLAGNCQYKQ